jgi:transposase
MLTPEQRAEVLRLYHAEGWHVGTIASQLGLHHSTVQRVLVEGGVLEARRSLRPSKLDPFLPFIREQLEHYPRLAASRLYHMIRARGYVGGEDHVRHVVALHRPHPPAEAFLRLRTLPGEQAQVDWGHFGTIVMGRAERPLMAFLMVLSSSRMLFLRFFLNQAMGSFLRGHVEAFTWFGGVPRVVLYDNLKSAVLERRRDAIRFNPTLLELAGHYRYAPRPVAVARGNEKGRVESAVRFVRSSFFAARDVSDLEDLNAQALAWCTGLAADRHWPEDRTQTVREAFAAERSLLLALPDHPFPTHERLEVKVGKTPYVRFDGNDYSVPHTTVRRMLVVLAEAQEVRILDGIKEVARHPRSYSKGEQIEDPRHVAALEETKREARTHRGLDRLHHAVPAVEPLLQAFAARGFNLGSATVALLRLLDHYGPAALAAAATEAVAKGSPHPQSVRLILERSERQRQTPPPLPVHLPDDPRVRELAVRPHDLGAYDTLGEDDGEAGDAS